MPDTRSSLPVRLLRGAWALLDGTRRAVLNLLFLALIGVLLWLLLRPGAPALPDKTALVLDLAGPVVEQHHGSARDGALARLRGDDSGQIRLRDVLAALDAAAADPQIAHAVLLLDGLAGAGLPTLREIAAALERFKAAGKPVYAWGSAYDQRSYFLAAHASEAWLHPMGSVFLEGYGRNRNYYKDLFDKAGIQVNVLRVGQYKSAGETFSASGPSAQTIESERLLFDAMWASWTGAVERARKLPAGSIAAGIDALPGSLVAAGGDSARLALQARQVDALLTRDQARQRLIERGAKTADGKSFAQVSLGAYLARVKPKTEGDAVGVIVAEGEISDGDAPGGRVGGLSTAELVRRAREDERIKAVVLRVDSPGGSAFGSELIRHELALTRAAGKPVVVSMGDLAASGGYWISLAADEVIADEATITGSIGVVALLPSARGALDRLGVATGGHTTTWVGQAFDLRRDLDPRLRGYVQALIDHAYGDFIGLAATARKTTPEKIDAVAQGRVWTGAQARERGLVDRVGGLREAVQAAAARAKLPAEARVQYLEREPGRFERLVQMVGARLGLALGLDTLLAEGAGLGATGAAAALGLPPQTAEAVAAELGWLAAVAQRRQPAAAVVHCLCELP